jgi:kumamolisin
MAVLLVVCLCACTPAPHKVSFAHPMRAAERKARALTPAELLKAYEIAALHEKGLTGKGTTIIIPAIDSFNQSDLRAFARANDLPAFDVTEVGDRPSGEGFGEVPMDLQIIHAVAPDAKLVVRYLPISIGDEAEVITQMSQRYPGAMWSWSLGWCEDADPGLARDVEAAVAEGSAGGGAHFVSTGDSAGYECYPRGKLFQPPQNRFVGVSMPAAAPSVTAVGGTRVLVGRGGAVIKETPWFRSVALSGTGGGSSSVFDGRTVPDVAADADPTTGMLFVLNGQVYSAGGTSASAPLWAGLAALTTQALEEAGKQRRGTFNDLIAAVVARHPDAFRDPKVGSNAVALSGPGKDEVTGWGAPNGEAFVRAALAESR